VRRERPPAGRRSARERRRSRSRKSATTPIRIRASIFIRRNSSIARLAIAQERTIRETTGRDAATIPRPVRSPLVRPPRLCSSDLNLLGVDVDRHRPRIGGRLLKTSRACCMSRASERRHPVPARRAAGDRSATAGHLRHACRSRNRWSPALKKRGFQFETVSQILCPTN